MKLRTFVPFLFAAGVWAQPAPPAAVLTPDTVVASSAGRKITYAEIQKFIEVMPQNVQQTFQQNKQEFVRQYALLKYLSEMAMKEKLDQTSPYKERLEAARTQMLAQAKIDQASRSVPITPEEQKKHYEANKDRYVQSKVKVIYIPFVAAPAAQPGADGKKQLTEAEAQARAAEVVKQARAGTDFVKLVKEHSQDSTSVQKDGDFGVFRRTDSLPDAIKQVIFALKAGEISDPVRQPNGFYVFRVTEIGAQPYDAVKDDIYNELKQAGFQKWLEQIRAATEVKFENDAYFATAPAK